MATLDDASAGSPSPSSTTGSALSALDVNSGSGPVRAEDAPSSSAEAVPTRSDDEAPAGKKNRVRFNTAEKIVILVAGVANGCPTRNGNDLIDIVRLTILPYLASVSVDMTHVKSD